MEDFTAKLYAVAQVREIEARAVASGIDSYALMQRAAARCWREISARWPQARHLVVVCGSGNNGGDGYEIAGLARRAGCTVRVLQVGAAPATGDGAHAAAGWRAAGGATEVFSAPALAGATLIVDALFGIGLKRDVEGATRAAIEAINARGVPVLAVDVPSGLDADTGAMRGAAVRASATVSFIARKLGLVTGAAAEHVGELVYDDLGVPAAAFLGSPAVAHELDSRDLKAALPRRQRNSHKGSHGHVLVVGGELGMMGAPLLAARAALRSGAGLVSVATRGAHAAALTSAQPEVMGRAVETSSELRALIQQADVVAIGPGLGQGNWSRDLLAAVLESDLPLVMDADALNLLAGEPARRPHWVLTPHPGEAARLLGSSAGVIQADRPAAVRALQSRFGGVAVLKGAGTLVQGSALAVCREGNPGMAVGGMGDVLCGIIAALIGQGLPPETAAQTGVLAHARAGDLAARLGERGLLPSDLIDALRQVVNP